MRSVGTKIGVFDSGMGGLKVLQDIRYYLPEYDYVFLGDTQNNPYGEKTGNEIRDFTFDALHYLFDEQDVGIVILACNTAAAYAIRDRQGLYSDKKVLSVTIPGVEAMVEQDSKHYGVLVTEATMASGVYPYLYSRFGGQKPGGLSGTLEVVAAQEIVKAVENGLGDVEERKKIISQYLKKFSEDIDSLTLGCTHFPIWEEEFAALFNGPKKVIIDPGEESAKNLVDYLERHPEIKEGLTRGGTVRHLVTGDPESFVGPARHLRGSEVSVERVAIG